jgi:hypothetical protein
MRAIASIAAGLLASTSVAFAQAPSAIVESVNGSVTGAEAMDYVAPGKVIRLGASGSIVIAYLTTCLRETISGTGVVTIGAERSDTSLPDVKLDKQMCDRRKSQLRDREATTAAGTVFRGRPRTSDEPERVTVFSLSPVFDVPEAGALLIERMDKPEQRREIVLGAKSLTKGRFYDTAAAGLEFRAGGLYSLKLGKHRLMLKIDQLAMPSGTLLERLVRF